MSLTEDEDASERLILPSLVMSRFATQPMTLLLGLLLVDIAETFETSIGVMGQIRTASSIMTVIFALLIGVLSVRFRHKSLLVVGLAFLSTSALGCIFAPNFAFMLLSYSLTGLAIAMVEPMSLTLLAEHFPLERRGRAIGWVISGMTVSYAVAAPSISFIAGFGGWRSALLAFVLPISLLSLLLVVKGIPSTPHIHYKTMSPRSYLEGFKIVFSKRSAVACFTGSALLMAAYQAAMFYGTSFFRTRHLIPVDLASLIILGAASSFTLGSQISGRWVNKFGSKPLSVSAAFFTGVFIISYVNVPDLMLSLAFRFLGSLFMGVTYAASSSLTLEQVPTHRGTMMSVSSASGGLGSVLGTGIGGLSLLLFDYEELGISLGSLAILAALIYQILTVDPTRK